jgi:ankyrin repeat protein
MSASTTFGCALTTATIYGHHRILSLVLKNRAIIDGHAHRHGTALHVAACMGNKPMVELPFRRRANINARAGMHGTAFFSSSLRSR